MHISILLMEQIVELFIMILMGFIIVKAGIVKDEDSKVLSKVVLYGIPKMPSYGEFVVKLRRGRDTMGIRMAIDRINANVVA